MKQTKNLFKGRFEISLSSITHRSCFQVNNFAIQIRFEKSNNFHFNSIKIPPLNSRHCFTIPKQYLQCRKRRFIYFFFAILVCGALKTTASLIISSRLCILHFLSANTKLSLESSAIKKAGADGKSCIFKPSYVNFPFWFLSKMFDYKQQKIYNLRIGFR